jgi:arylsulfatase A-like enzyme/Tfp pilus assembly protein PilF
MMTRKRWPMLAATVLLAACRSGGPPAARRLNVLLVTVDTLRPDRLGCYGYPRIETPNLDRIARQGVLFENAVAPAPLTAPSHASMMTGVYPTVHKVRNTGGFVLSPSQPTLAKLLQDQGWDTAAFIGSSVLKRRFGLNQGFAVYDDEMPAQAGGSAQEEPERRASEVVDRAVKWLDAQSGKPFLLWAHVYDPHIPYDPPSPFREKYRDRPYDGEIAYTDQQLGRLFDAAARKAPAENTLIVVLSDHGESFSEHGEYTHGVFLYDSTLRIAFLIAGGPIPGGVRVKQQARTIDLLPTILELAGGHPPAGIQGSSLAPSFRGKEIGATDSYAETLFPKLNMGWAELRSMRTVRWKYIRAPKPELYDVARDPGETANVIASHPAEAQELESKLAAIAGRSEKVAPAAMDPRTLQQLKSLGYLGGSSTESAELTGKGIDPKDRLEILRLLHLATHSDASPPERISLLRQAIARDPANPSLYNSLGNLYAEAGRQAEAMQLYDSALRKGVRAAWLYSRLGSLYLRQRKTSEAITLFETATQLNPSDYESLENLAVAYRQAGRMEDCERALNAILRSGEEYPPAYNELGMTAYQKGDVAAAQGYFEKAARLDPTYQLNLARFYKMSGDNARARAAFEAFLAARSSSPEYRQIIPQVQKELEAVQ